MIDSTGGKSLIECGMDAKASAPIKRAQFAVEEATEQEIVWLDLVPGKENSADLCTKNIGEFQAKNGIICGSEPHLYETGTVRKILCGANIPLQAFKKKRRKRRRGNDTKKSTVTGSSLFWDHLQCASDAPTLALARPG